MSLVLAIDPTQLSPEGARKRQTVAGPRDPELVLALKWVQGARIRRKKASGEEVRAGSVKLESGGWVRVGGILKFDNSMDPSLPVIHAATISKVSEPSEPYM